MKLALTRHFNFLHRKLAEAKKDVGELQNEAVELHSAAAKLQSKVAALNCETKELKDTSLKQKFEIQLSEAIIKKVSLQQNLQQRR